MGSETVNPWYFPFSNKMLIRNWKKKFKKRWTHMPGISQLWKCKQLVIIVFVLLKNITPMTNLIKSSALWAMYKFKLHLTGIHYFQLKHSFQSSPCMFDQFDIIFLKIFVRHCFWASIVILNILFVAFLKPAWQIRVLFSASR